jgi:hypothetical protein
VADSLVLAGIELLAGGVASDHPLCPGAKFYLAKGWDFGAPATTFADAINLIMAGSLPSAGRTANRAPKLPVVITVPASGDGDTDRALLAGARELLMQSISADEWNLVWTRSGGLPFILPCFAATAVTVDWDLLRDRQRVSTLSVEFGALPFGRSDVAEQVTFKSTAAAWTPPPDPVVIDSYGSGQKLSADNSTFEATAGTWVNVTNCGVARSTTRHHTGVASLAVTSSAAGAMTAALCSLANVPTQGVPVTPGQLVTVSGYHRAQTAGQERTAYIEAEFATSGGASLGAVASAGVTEVAANGNWSAQQTVTGTAPATAAGFRVRARWATPAAGAEIHYVDDVYADVSAVASAVDAASWSPSFQRVNGSYSAHWSAHKHACAIYDVTLPAALDITGRSKLMFWLGLGTATPSAWRRGQVTVKAVLYDAAGMTVTASVTQLARAGSLTSVPHWNRASLAIPANSAFDYTTVSRYVLTVWNHTEGGGQRVLQADAYLNDLGAVPSSAGTPGPRGAVHSIPGGVGTAPAPVAVQCQPGPSVAPTVTEYTTSGTKSWTAPAGCTSVHAECWGAGGGGEGGHTSRGGAGGGGGEYAMDGAVPVTPLSVYAPVVGAAGSGGAVQTAGGGGGDTYFTGDSGVGVRAHGGQGGGVRADARGGYGGSGSTGDAHFPGGDGADTFYGYDEHGQGGGGSAGPSSPGNDARSQSEGTGAAAVTGGGPGGQGGHHIPESGQLHTGYAPASGPGGGGGGGGVDESGTRYAAGAGYAGKMRLSYATTAGAPFKTLLLHHIPPGSPGPLAPMVAVGGGTDAPGGTYTAPLTGQLNARYAGTYRVLLGCNWNTPGSARNVTLTIRQKQTGMADQSVTLSRAGVVPDTDTDPADGPVANGIIDMGLITLPLSPIAPGNNSDWFQFQTGSTNSADRFLDLLILDVTYQTLLYSLPSGATAWANNIWADTPDLGHDLGLVYGSQADRDQAVSVLAACDYSGGPLWIGDGDHRLLAWSAQCCPALILSYLPFWYLDRLA